MVVTGGGRKEGRRRKERTGDGETEERPEATNV